jgi:hypothetical protein
MNTLLEKLLSKCSLLGALENFENYYRKTKGIHRQKLNPSC